MKPKRFYLISMIWTSRHQPLQAGHKPVYVHVRSGRKKPLCALIHNLDATATLLAVFGDIREGGSLAHTCTVGHHQKAPVLWPPGGALALLGAPRGRGASGEATTFASPSFCGAATFSVGSNGAMKLVLRSLAFCAEAAFLGGAFTVTSSPNPMEDLPPGGASTCQETGQPIPFPRSCPPCCCSCRRCRSRAPWWWPCRRAAGGRLARATCHQPPAGGLDHPRHKVPPLHTSGFLLPYFHSCSRPWLSPWAKYWYCNGLLTRVRLVQ